ncbi:acetate--CoA ligase family protein [Ancylobacter sp. MQZ15Z-1]|uniref:Acetate--CoA ligase family protein n=1 Tax=Ancylobacter mangrovi TaxID=2972472 RepID=A0A9X2T5W2_9HYPH|nr:acetate--CoA ligase [Ancylobacter mangrovi]MCS0497706.1 acetate--CoA ligase family protein [Ancylobacter mangrovi]
MSTALAKAPSIVTQAGADMPAALDFLKPRSVAIIGASRDPSKRGNRAIQTLLDCGYAGTILPINPKETEILGLPCYPDLASAPGEIDLAMVCTPARVAPEVIALCGERDVHGALVLAGGFSEAGPAGAELEARTLAAARKGNVRLIGPNTNGMFDGHTGLNLTGWPSVYAGGLGVLSQSGNVALSLLAQSHQNGHAGFSTFVGVGNEGDIRFHEYLRFFGDDPNTKAVIVYAEGFKDGRAFLEAAREVARRKPVVLYKAGRTDQGEGAARSHSGSLAGNYVAASAALRQAGVIQVERSDEMFVVADLVSRTGGRPTRGVAVLSEGGGPISQAADALAERGLDLPPLAEATVAALQTITPNASQLSNPIDAGGGTDPHPRYMPACAREILADLAVDALLIVGYFGGYQVRYGASLREIENEAAHQLVALAREHGKPVVVQCHYAEFPTEAIAILREGGIVVVRSIEIAAAALAAAQRFHEVSTAPMDEASAPTPASAEAAQLAAAARTEGRSALLEPEAMQALAGAGVAIPPFALLRAPADAARLPAELLAGPVALKIVSRDILHKSDVGGVRLGISGAAAIEAESAALLAHIGATCPGADIAGVLVTPMAGKGVEVVIGVTEDPQFGRLLMFGLGGVFVEIMKDVVFRTLPVSRSDAREMLDQIRGRALLEGARGMAPVDREGLVELLLEVSALAMSAPDFVEIDLNPVIVNAEGCAVVDARILLAGDAG